MPAQPLLRAPALVDEIITVIDQEPQFAQPLLARTGSIQARLAQSGPRDRQRIDRVGLAAYAT